MVDCNMYTCSGNMILSRVSGGMQFYLFDMTGKARNAKQGRLVMYTGRCEESGIITIPGNDRDYGFFRTPATGAQVMYLSTPFLTSRKSRLQTTDRQHLDRNTIG